MHANSYTNMQTGREHRVESDAQKQIVRLKEEAGIKPTALQLQVDYGKMVNSLYL